MIVKCILGYLVIGLLVFALFEIRNLIENHRLDRFDVLADFVIGMLWPLVLISAIVFNVDCIQKRIDKYFS